MLNHLVNWRTDAQRRRNRTRSVVLLSLIVHMLFAIGYLFIPDNQLVQDQADALAVDLLNDADAPKRRKPKPKPPLTKKMLDPNRDLARNALQKKIETAPNEMDEVMKISSRVVLKDVELNDALRNDFIPDLMTDAELREAEASNLSRLVSEPGRTDGRGKVTGRVRAKGDGMGRFRGDSQDGAEGGLLGGGGKDGAADRLGVIDFLDELQGPKDVVYCLDVSASMQAAGLKKLELAVSSIQDSIMRLGSEDTLNVVAFFGEAEVMDEEMLPATAGNIKDTFRFLDKFTPQRIANNAGTDILEALRAAFALEPSVIVLVTDGLPTTVEGYDIEKNPQVILDAVQHENLNNARIYVVALEFDRKLSHGAELLISLAEDHNGKLRVIDSTELYEFVEMDGIAE